MARSSRERSGMWIDQGWSLQGSQMNALYAARAYRNAAFSVASGWNKVPLDKTSFDAIGGFNLPSSRYVCPVSGLYHVDGNVTANTTAAGLFMVAVYKNGVQRSSGVGAPVAPASSTETNVNVSDIVQCNAGDYLELWFFIVRREASRCTWLRATTSSPSRWSQPRQSSSSRSNQHRRRGRTAMQRSHFLLVQPQRFRLIPPASTQGTISSSPTVATCAQRRVTIKSKAPGRARRRAAAAVTAG